MIPHQPSACLPGSTGNLPSQREDVNLGSEGNSPAKRKERHGRALLLAQVHVYPAICCAEEDGGNERPLDPWPLSRGLCFGLAYRHPHPSQDALVVGEGDVVGIGFG